jgi:hypothetical protein
MISSELVEGLAQPLASERRLAAQEIGETGDPAAAELLLAQLKTETARAVKEAILRGLSNLWSSSPVEPIIELLRDADPFVRAEAADMLQRRAGGALEGLTAMMQDTDKDLRKFSMDIIGQSSAGVQDALYLGALEDPDKNVVISAVENIGLGRRTVFLAPVLALVLGDVHPMTVCACLETLAVIGDQHTLAALRHKFPSAVTVSGLYLHSFLKLLGGTGTALVMEEICATLVERGSGIYPVAIDALSRVTARERVTVLTLPCEKALCHLLVTELASDIRYHLVRLLGHFTQSTPVALALLPCIQDGSRDEDRALALAESPLAEVEAALQLFLASELQAQAAGGSEVLEELEEILRRRPRWNSQPSSSPS